MKKLFLIIIILVTGIIAFAGYSGLFYTIPVTEQEIGPLTMILKEHRGSYFDTQETFDQVNRELKKFMDTGTLKGIGIYYDDPAAVQEKDLRSECGFIIDQAGLKKIAPVRKPFIIKDFGRTRCVTGEFPIKSFLSYMIGPSRAYPKIGRFIKEKKYKTKYGMEIYDMQAGKIIYCMPIIE